MKKLLIICSMALTSIAVNAQSSKVEVVKMKPQTALVKTIKAKADDLGSAVPSAISSVEKAIAVKKLKVTGPNFTKTVSYSNGIYHLEAGTPILNKADAIGGLDYITLPGGNIATVTYVGPYEDNYKGYQTLDAWMKLNKKKRSGSPWEVYLDDPAKTPAAKLRTQIFYPL